jgi:hypothetical protein
MDVRREEIIEIDNDERREEIVDEIDIVVPGGELEIEKMVFDETDREYHLQGVAGESRKADRILALQYRVLCEYIVLFGYS